MLVKIKMTKVLHTSVLLNTIQISDITINSILNQTGTNRGHLRMCLKTAVYRH